MGEDEKERYRNCLTLILNCTDDKFEDTSENPPYNAFVSKDVYGNIPLHYATRFWNKDEEDRKIIKKVLEKGGLATIGIESGSSDLGIHGLKPEVNFSHFVEIVFGQNIKGFKTKWELNYVLRIK